MSSYILCNSPVATLVATENGYKLYRCAECGLLFVAPRPSNRDIARRYRNDKALLTSSVHLKQSLFKRLCAKHNWRIIRDHVSEGSLLEIGPGGGEFLQAGLEFGFHLEAIEPNPIQAEAISQRTGIRCWQTTDISKLRIGPFDVVYHRDVLSHFPEPILSFQQMHDILVQDGIVVFETGNYAELEEAYFPLIERWGLPDHLFFFGGQQVTTLLELSGFEVLELRRYSKVPEMMLTRAVATVTGRHRTRKEASMGRHSESREPDGLGAGASPLRTVFHHMRYAARYLAGRYAPKSGRPQSLVIVARAV